MNHTVLATPAGPLTMVVDDAGVLTAAGFGTVTDLTTDAGRPMNDLGEVTAAVRAYLDGQLDACVDLPVRQPWADGFVAAAWLALRTIPPGTTWTYRELAVAAGRPAAARAAANACGGNPVALVVPCHRVLRTGGGLGGYRWGLSVKRWLLAHERRVTARQPGSPHLDHLAG